MPDVHYGSGCVVGFTATLGNRVCPNVIGVDIGCGMLTVDLGKREIDLAALDGFIHECIPAGSNLRKSSSGTDFVDRLYCAKELRTLRGFIARSVLSAAAIILLRLTETVRAIAI